MGTFLLVNINYILSFAFIDAIVHYNVPDVWNSGLWACVVSSAPMGPIMRISDGFGAGIPWLPNPTNCEVHPAPFGHRDSGFEDQHQPEELNGRSIKCVGTQRMKICGVWDTTSTKEGK